MIAFTLALAIGWWYLRGGTDTPDATNEDQVADTEALPPSRRPDDEIRDSAPPPFPPIEVQDEIQSRPDDSVWSCDGSKLLTSLVVNATQSKGPTAAARELAQFDDAELVVAAVLLGWRDDGLDTLMQRLEQAVQLAPRNPLVMWQAALLCTAQSPAELCQSDGYGQNVEDVLGNNGAYWALVAADRIRDGDEEASLAALRRAGAEPQFDTYLFDYVSVVERGLSISTQLGPGERILLAMSWTYRHADWGHSMVTDCKDRRGSELWWDACLDYAERLAGEPVELVRRLQGLDLMASLYASAGEQVRVREIEAAVQEIETDMQSLDASDAGLVLLADESVWRACSRNGRRMENSRRTNS